MITSSSQLLYEEFWSPKWAPLVFFLPFFYSYGVIIEKSYEEGKSGSSIGGEEDERKEVTETANATADAIVDATAPTTANANANANATLTFGYGFRQPGALTAHKTPLKNIVTSSIITGHATWRDNLLTFGGWGIRYGYSPTQERGTWAYNAENGDFIEFVDTKGYKYRFVTRNANQVLALLRQGDQN